MKLSRSVALSIEILAARRLRTLLSVLGIVVGVGVVIVMVAAGQGAAEQILRRVRGMGTNLVIVNAGKTSIIAGRQRQMNTVRTLLVSDALAIARECPSVSRAAATVSNKLHVRWEDRNAITNVVGMDADGLAVRGFVVCTGRTFEEEDVAGARRVAILGPTAAGNLFGSTNPTGQRLLIKRVPFEVIGVTAPKGMDVNGLDQDDLLVVPLKTAMRRLFNQDHVHTVHARARSSNATSRAEQEIAGLLRLRHRLRDKPDDFTIQNQATVFQTEQEATRSLTLLIVGVAGVSLLVGGVGILAVMVLSVRERTGEIGLRRAVGAQSRDIRNQFLIESGLLAGMGGLAGVVVGVGTVSVVSALGHWPMTVPWSAAAIAFTFALGVGMIFGLLPAIRAAGLHPIQALRMR
ncbi:MAG: ABC transporter permease [Candidatus Riflebacteria bacterium]|nr:ABC transporter permease [Candidatus Riflebacteria bacterium]